MPCVEERQAVSPREGFSGAVGSALIDAEALLTNQDGALSQMLFGLRHFQHMGPRQRHRHVEPLIGLSWEQFRAGGFEAFAARLIHALLLLPRIDAPPGLLRQPYHLRSLVHTYVEPTKESPFFCVVEERDLVVDAEHLETWRASQRLQYGSSLAPPVLRFSGARGAFSCKVLELSGQAGRGYQLELSVDFDEPLRRGDTTTFTIVRTLAVDVDKYQAAGSNPRFTGIASPGCIDELRLSVQFDPEHPPGQVRRLTAVAPIDRFRTDLEPAVLETMINPGAYVATSWEDLAPTRWHGLVWQ